MALTRAGLATGLLALLLVPALAAPPEPEGQGSTKDAPARDESLVYIFSGALPKTNETFSGTLVDAAGGTQVELKLGRGATCEASRLDPDKGFLRLPESPCSDGRVLKALFVYQEGGVLRVYGTIGGDRFAAQAHVLPSDAPEPVPAKPAAPPADLMDRAK